MLHLLGVRVTFFLWEGPLLPCSILLHRTVLIIILEHGGATIGHIQGVVVIIVEVVYSPSNIRVNFICLCLKYQFHLLMYTHS